MSGTGKPIDSKYVGGCMGIGQFLPGVVKCSGIRGDGCLTL